MKYKGSLYQLRYNIYIDLAINPMGYKNLEAIQILADGNRTVLEIAHQLDIVFYVHVFFEILEQKGLAEAKVFCWNNS